MNKGGFVVKKQEMTRVWVDDKFVPVTIVKVMPQEIVRYKTDEKDGYTAVVIGLGKKEKETKKGKKIVYKDTVEFKVESDYIQNNQIGKIFDLDIVQGIESVDVVGVSKGKGFQGMVKRCHIKGGGATHGHKFTRTGGSKGNRKPRRTLKGHPHAGHMGVDRVTLKDIKVLDVIKTDKEQLIALKGSLPGAYNGMLKINLN
ncbi:MAG: 50S ribosomal protein L3 [Candidatus Absconditabacteria bacterium]|nr:50S ribosomal protein L3 [Candidatus Absconditabacteria bacterium]